MSRPSALAEASRPPAAVHETLPVTIYLACRYEPAQRRAGFGAILVSGPHTKSVSGTLDACSALEAGLGAVGAVLGHLHRPETCLVAIVTNAVALAQQIASTQDALNTREPVRQVRALIARCARCVAVYRPLRANGLGQADALAAAAVASSTIHSTPARVTWPSSTERATDE